MNKKIIYYFFIINFFSLYTFAFARSDTMKIDQRILDFLMSTGIFNMGIGSYIMISIGCLLIFLGIVKEYEPLLLIPIGTGCIICNAPVIGDVNPKEMIAYLYTAGIDKPLYPLLIFLGVGALTDFGPLIANPKTALLGAAAQFGIFFTLIGAIVLGFNLKEASSIGIIGGADGPTTIFLTAKLAPDLLGATAVAAYSYMALVPIIQPPIIKLLTTEEERGVVMKQLKPVSKRAKILFPVCVIILCILLVPSAVPLIGMLMFGNLIREAGVVRRLSDVAQNALINIVTIFLGICIGYKMQAEYFLRLETIKILILGVIAFSIGTASGVILAKIMAKLSRDPINPLIGSAGVSAVPMAARVSQKVAQEANPSSHILMHAMGPNVSGVIGSAVAAGVLLSLFG